MIRVLVAAGTAIMRAGLEALVAANPDLAVVGRSAPGAPLAQEIAALQPDVVLLELEWRDGEPATALPEAGPGAPAYVLLADAPGGHWVGELVQAGAHAVLPREATPEEIAAAIRASAAGLITLHPAFAAALVTAAPRAQPVAASQPLTAREIEVLGMLAEGLGNKAIARQLGISEHTVKFHVGSILTKLNAASRTEAVTIGARQGLIML